MSLKVDFCSHEAAKYAVEHWHYSRTMPKSKLVKFGVWEDGAFIGAVIYGVGATSDLVKAYGIKPIEGCELVRIALTSHQSSVTQIVARTLKVLKQSNPGLRLVVSFADPEQNHQGVIYQAGNWIFAGCSIASEEYVVRGERLHGRTLRHGKPQSMTTKEYAKRLDPNFQVIKGSSKYRYLYPLDKRMRAQIAPLAQPYPKRAADVSRDTAGDQPEEGGSTPTQPLNNLMESI